MARLAGISIPDNKQIFFSLTYIYGVGLPLSKKILKQANVDKTKRTDQLTQEEMGRIRQIFEKSHRVEGDLRRDIMINVKRLKDIGSWRGMRHAKHLPVRGQQTRTNTRTVRGNVRKTVTSGKRAAPSPT